MVGKYVFGARLRSWRVTLTEILEIQEVGMKDEWSSWCLYPVAYSSASSAEILVADGLLLINIK